jgi:hypothetical protein
MSSSVDMLPGGKINMGMRIVNGLTSNDFSSSSQSNSLSICRHSKAGLSKMLMGLSGVPYANPRILSLTSLGRVHQIQAPFFGGVAGLGADMVWREFSRVGRVSSDMVTYGSSRRFDQDRGDVDELGVCRYACRMFEEIIQ